MLDVEPTFCILVDMLCSGGAVKKCHWCQIYLLIYLHDRYYFTIAGQYNHSDLRDGVSIEVQVESLEWKLTIGNIYRPPKYNDNNATIEIFSDEVSPLLASMGKKCSNVIVAGDFSIDLFWNNERKKYQKYFDVFVANGHFPLITQMKIMIRYKIWYCKGKQNTSPLKRP